MTGSLLIIKKLLVVPSHLRTCHSSPFFKNPALLLPAPYSAPQKGSRTPLSLLILWDSAALLLKRVKKRNRLVGDNRVSFCRFSFDTVALDGRQEMQPFSCNRMSPHLVIIDVMLLAFFSSQDYDCTRPNALILLCHSYVARQIQFSRSSLSKHFLLSSTTRPVHKGCCFNFLFTIHIFHLLFQS